jgi:hypothetical protein
VGGLLGDPDVEVRSHLAPDHPVSFSLVVQPTREDAWDRGAIVRGFWGCPDSAWGEWRGRIQRRRVACRFGSSDEAPAGIRVVAVAVARVACGRRGIARGMTCANVDIRIDGDGRRRYEVTASAPCILVASDVHYPWWRAMANGVDRVPERINHSMVGVPVSPGRSTVHLRVEFTSVTYGAGISMLAGLCWTGLAVVSAVRRPSSSRPAS